MAESRTFNASCLCGGLCASARAEPRDVYVCACRNCQKKSGSAFTYAAIFAAEEVSITGAHTSFRFPGDSGRWVESNFCPTCGGFVFFRTEGLPGTIGINVGAFDGADLSPRRMYWTSSRHQWLHMPDGLPQIEKQ